MKKFTTFETQLGESVVLTDKAKLSLYKKSQNSGYSVDILEEVYRRGFSIWNESFGGSPDSFAFDRVNSFIAGGFAAQLDEDLKKACWKGYEAIGMKKKNGKTVPNCVPVKEQLNQPTPSINQIAKKHNKPITVIKAALSKGVKVEKEHTRNSRDAAEIARDHLGERPDYYEKFAKFEKQPVEEGKLKDLAKVGAVVGAMGAHGGKMYDIGNVATHHDDPALAAATMTSYIHPASRALQALPTVLKVDKAGKGENEFARQKKYGKKPVKEDAEKHSKNPNDPASRFIGSNELTDIYMKQTPGQIIKKVVKECLEEGDVIKTKFAVKNMQKRGIEGPHKQGASDLMRTYAAHPFDWDKDDLVSYHGTTARIHKDGKHLDISNGAHGLDASIKTKIVKKKAPEKKGNVVAMKEDEIDEATYQGKQVPLNKPMKGDVKKSKVFVDPDGDGKAQKVNFGDKNMSIKKDQPARKKSYCARSGGQGNLTDKTSANYWSRKAWNCEETEIDETSTWKKVKYAAKAYNQQLKIAKELPPDDVEKDKTYQKRVKGFKTLYKDKK